MFFRKRIIEPVHSNNDNENGRLAETIKKDIISSLQRKGIRINGIQIDMEYNSLNVKVCINEE